MKGHYDSLNQSTTISENANNDTNQNNVNNITTTTNTITTNTITTNTINENYAKDKLWLLELIRKIRNKEICLVDEEDCIEGQACGVYFNINEEICIYQPR